MKFKNTTPFADRFLRRLLSWCCRHAELKVREIHSAQFTKSSFGCRGRAFWPRRILVRISEQGFPFNEDLHHAYRGGPAYCMADPYEALVAITTHELRHIHQYSKGQLYGRGREAACEATALQALNEFRANRETLLAEWNAAEPEQDKPVISIADVRFAKVQQSLDRWLRKAKLAATKIKKLKQKVAYYERRQAAKGASND